LFQTVLALVPVRAARHVCTMRARQPRRDSKRAVARAYDSSWTAIAITVAVTVAIAVGAFYWFIA
jgi:hypothetical protein